MILYDATVFCQKINILGRKRLQIEYNRKTQKLKGSQTKQKSRSNISFRSDLPNSPYTQVNANTQKRNAQEDEIASGQRPNQLKP